MWKIAQKLQGGLRDLEFNIGNTLSPITPIHFSSSDKDKVLKAIRYLREEKRIFTVAVAYPIVPIGEIVFRLIPTANHSEDDVEITIEAFKDLRELGIISPT